MMKLLAAISVSLLFQPTPPQLSGVTSSAASHAGAYLALLAEGWHTSADDAKRLEAQLAAIPEPRATHLFWLIENHPEADIFRNPSVLTSTAPDWSGLNSPVNGERARALWLKQSERFATNTKVLANAAQAFIQIDSRTSLGLVRRARALEPDAAEWVNWLGAIYARAVRANFAGGSDKIRSFTGASNDRDARLGFPLPLPESQLLKAELETATDTALVEATANALIIETSALLTFDNRPNEELLQSADFGKRLLSRVGGTR